LAYDDRSQSVDGQRLLKTVYQFASPYLLNELRVSVVSELRPKQYDGREDTNESHCKTNTRFMSKKMLADFTLNSA
jgi:hypothetical protein